MSESRFRKVLRKIYSEPHGITVIKGDWKTGKTDFGLHLYEILTEMGLIQDCAGNIQTYSDSDCEHPINTPIKYVDNFLELKAFMFRNLHRKMFLYDETMKNAPSKKAMTLLNSEWQRVIPELSKGKMHLIAFTQEESMTEKIFMHRTFNVAKWEKIRLPPTHPQYRKLVKVSSKLLRENYQFRNVKRTRVFFNPYLSATWTMEPKQKNTLIENSLELKVTHEYMSGMSFSKIRDAHPELLHNTQVQRLIRSGLKSLFGLLQVTEDSSGIVNAQGSNKTKDLISDTIIDV